MARGINYYWRLFATGLCFVIFGVCGLLLPLFATPWIKLTSANPAQRQRRARLLLHRLFHFYVHLMRALGVLRWTIEGQERLQRPGLLVLANHPSLIDVVFLIALIPNPDCIVKGRLLANPAMSGFLRLTGFLMNDSGEALLEGARASLAAGSALIIFPEGTRTVPGEPLRFQRGAANVALRTDTAVTPVTILCQPVTLSKQHKWHQIPSQKLHIRLLVGEDIAVSGYDQRRPALAARKLTQDLQEYFTEELRTHDNPR